MLYTAWCQTSVVMMMTIILNNDYMCLTRYVRNKLKHVYEKSKTYSNKANK